MKKKWTKILSAMALSIIGAIIFMFSLCATCKADTIDYDLLTSNYTTTIYLYNTNVIDTQSNLSFKNIDNFNMIDIKYPYTSSVTSLNREVITYSTTKTITSNMNLYIKYNDTNTRINFNLDNEVQFSFIQGTTPTTINGNINVYNFTEEIVYNRIEVFNSYIATENEEAVYFTILNANERAYNLGYNAGMQRYYELDAQYQQLQNSYSELDSLYNGLASGQYTFESLFWSVGSVPMAVLLQTFNVNVLGMNIRAIITGLLTALVVIWLIKRLFK